MLYVYMLSFVMFGSARDKTLSQLCMCVMCCVCVCEYVESYIFFVLLTKPMITHTEKHRAAFFTYFHDLMAVGIEKRKQKNIYKE